MVEQFTLCGNRYPPRKRCGVASDGKAMYEGKLDDKCMRAVALVLPPLRPPTTDNAVWARFEQDSVFDAERGHTFGVGVAAFVFGLVQAAVVLFCFRQAGHGPLLSCVRTRSLTPRPVYVDPLPQRKSHFFSSPTGTGGGNGQATSGFSNGNPKIISAAEDADDGIMTADV